MASDDASMAMSSLQREEQMRRMYIRLSIPSVRSDPLTCWKSARSVSTVRRDDAHTI